MPSRFLQSLRAILIVLLQKALLALEIQPESYPTGTYDDLADLSDALTTVYQFLVTLVGQIRRIHYLLIGMYVLIRLSL